MADDYSPGPFRHMAGAYQAHHALQHTTGKVMMRGMTIEIRAGWLASRPSSDRTSIKLALARLDPGDAKHRH